MQEQHIFSPEEILVSLSMQHGGDFDKIRNAITSRNPIPQERGELPEGVKAITILELQDKLPKTMPGAPYVLYCKGDQSLLYDALEKGVAIVGSRDCSNEEAKTARDFAAYCAEHKIPVVSGMAMGIDTEALTEYMRKGGRPVVFLGNGFNHHYPSCSVDLEREIAEKGLLVTEYPPDIPPKPINFPMRNRLIATFSKATLAIGLCKHSGTYVTIGFAANLGKQIGVIPHSLSDEGDMSNKLIQEGAYPVLCGEDIETLIGSGKGEVQHGQIISTAEGKEVN